MATLAQINVVKEKLKQMPELNNSETFIAYTEWWPDFEPLNLGLLILVPPFPAAGTIERGYLAGVKAAASKIARDNDDVRINLVYLPDCFRRGTSVNEQMIRLQVAEGASFEEVVDCTLAVLQRFKLNGCHLIGPLGSFDVLPTRAYLEDEGKKQSYIAYLSEEHRRTMERRAQRSPSE